MTSLSGRLLLALSILLLAFFSITILALDYAFRATAEKAVADRLEIQLTGLLSAANIDEFGAVSFPNDMPEARFNNPGSGLFGQVLDEYEERIWRSGSLVGLNIIGDYGLLGAGETRFETLALDDGERIFARSLGVVWELSEVQNTRLSFTVAESFTPYYAQVNRFRTQLLGWFGTIMLLMLAAQALLMRWVLSPLRRIESEVREVESGERTALGSGYPKELHGATQNINTLVQSERDRLTRYRNTLGNLAHSLKTPLAVLRNTLESGSETDQAKATMEKQIDRMNDIVGYQLQKAAASGGVTLGHAPVDVVAEMVMVKESLDKVYNRKGVHCDLVFDSKTLVHYFGDKGDLLEILGNVMDNAYKWCQSRVQVTLERLSSESGGRSGMGIIVEDDGPGIDSELAERVLHRGARADESVDGQGIGLAVVKELVSLQGGQLKLLRSTFGGAKIDISIPPK